MDRERVRRISGVVATVTSIAVAVAAAVSLGDTVRWVDIVALFAGGFGAGAGTLHLVTARARRNGRRAAP